MTILSFNEKKYWKNNRQGMTQKEFVKCFLVQFGEMSLSNALDFNISRLGAIICDLRNKEDWKIRTQMISNKRIFFSQQGYQANYILLNKKR